LKDEITPDVVKQPNGKLLIELTLKRCYAKQAMNKLIPLAKFSKKASKLSFLSKTSVVIDKKGTPLGFVFGRDSFISFLEHIDSQFEEKVKDSEIAFNNPAGRLIDLIEEKLSPSPRFVKNLKLTLARTKKKDWIPLGEVIRALNV